MRPLCRLLFVPLLITHLGGCASSATLPATPSTSVKTSTPQVLNSALVGALEGFSGTSARLKSSDAPKISIVAQDEHGTTIVGTDAVAPDANGGFTIKNVPPGAYFVVATLPDKSTNLALLRTDQPGTNFISPGTTLGVVWAKHQLDTKLVFLGDLPFADLLRAGVQIDSLLNSKTQTLASGDDARLTQITTLASGDAGLMTVFSALDLQLANRATTNRDKVPTYVSQKDYDAKKKKLNIS
jgi:hypothetical protein